VGQEQDAIRQKVAGQVDQAIWQTTGTGQVTVQREALAVILPIVDIGLAHSDALADLEEAIAHPRAALADGAPNSSRDGRPRRPINARE
jgi:hypothetical protein